MEVEQLLSLSGSALAQAISALLETPGLYVFSDILELPNVREVSQTCETQHATKQDYTVLCVCMLLFRLYLVSVVLSYVLQGGFLPLIF